MMDSSPVVQVLLPVALLCGGLLAGGLMNSVLGAVPLRLSLPPEQAVYAHQFMVSRLDRVMPAILIVSMVSIAVAGFFMPTAATGALSLLSAALQLTALLLSVIRLVPINRWLAQLDPAALPVDFAQRDPRIRWRNDNLARAGLAQVAWLLNVVVVALLL